VIDFAENSLIVRDMSVFPTLKITPTMQLQTSQTNLCELTGGDNKAFVIIFFTKLSAKQKLNSRSSNNDMSQM